MTGVNPSEILGNAEKTRVRMHGFGCWGNPRVVMGIRVDSELKKQFTAVSKRIFGSTCNPIESFMATIVACAETGVNFGRTVEIGKIIIERNLRPRRNLEADGDVSDAVTVGCTVRGCTNSVVATAVYLPRNEEYRLCKGHLAEARQNPRLWRLDQGELLPGELAVLSAAPCAEPDRAKVAWGSQEE